VTGQLSAYRIVRRKLYFYLTLFILKLFKILPDGLGKKLCRLMASAAIKIRPEYLKAAKKNLLLALPDGNHQQIIDKMIFELGSNIHDSLLLFSNRDSLLKSVTCCPETVKLLQNRRVLILTGHFGCWELLGCWLAKTCNGLTVVTGTIHNKSVDELVNKQRKNSGITAVRRGGDLRPIVKALKLGKAVAVLMDQNNPVDNLNIPFFGKDAPTSAGFAKLALKYKVPILPVSIFRNDSGFEVIAGDLIEINSYYETNDTVGLLTECNLCLEKIVRNNPSEWVWFHNRWGNS
jgi:Kdo2-lipid IVA lauroyltransferase/acyltransferase